MASTTDAATSPSPTGEYTTKSWRDVLPIHPAADLFPLMSSPDELRALAEDARIRKNGLQSLPKVQLDQNGNPVVLDGRNRLDALELLGVEITTDTPDKRRIFEPISHDVAPYSYVVSANIHRRHLSAPKQKRDVIAKLLQATPEKSNRQIAETVKVSHVTVGTVRADLEGRGQIDHVSTHTDTRGREQPARKPPTDVRDIVAVGKREIIETAKRFRAEDTEARRAERIERIAEIAKGNTPLPTGQRWPVLYADPPWQFRVYDAESGLDHAADAHYPTLPHDELCALPVAALATPDAVLFMWSTVPHLAEALAVLAAWGFDYVSHMVWEKDKLGLGYWVRNQHEILLIARRGDFPAPPPSVRPPSVIHAPRREHSRKPDEFYEIIERMYPTLPKIELFARHARPGWAAWGNQIASEAATKSDSEDSANAKVAYLAAAARRDGEQ